VLARAAMSPDNASRLSFCALKLKTPHLRDNGFGSAAQGSSTRNSLTQCRSVGEAKVFLGGVDEVLVEIIPLIQIHVKADFIDWLAAPRARHQVSI
jgi:hypothetical protein